MSAKAKASLGRVPIFIDGKVYSKNAGEVEITPEMLSLWATGQTTKHNYARVTLIPFEELQSFLRRKLGF